MLLALGRIRLIFFSEFTSGQNGFGNYNYGTSFFGTHVDIRTIWRAPLFVRKGNEGGKKGRRGKAEPT
jgi:hypothetical protein